MYSISFRHSKIVRKSHWSPSYPLPELFPRESRFVAVRAYYQLLSALASFSKAILPQASNWAQNEMGACTRFVAVSMDARLKSNEAFLAELRSY